VPTHVLLEAHGVLVFNNDILDLLNIQGLNCELRPLHIQGGEFSRARSDTGDVNIGQSIQRGLFVWQNWSGLAKFWFWF